MAEETPEVTPEVVPEVTPEPEAKKPQVKIDSSRSLSSQASKLTNLLESTDVKPNDKGTEEAPKAVEAEPKKEAEPVVETEEPAEVEETELPKPDDEYVEPVELPPVAKYILDNLPEIQTIGHEGEGKDKVYRVKRLEDLPDDFEFSTKRAELAFTQALTAQEMNARELLGKYQAEERQNQVNEMLNQQAVDVAADVKSLQQEGILPKFQYEDTDPKFNSDPAVKEANAIYKVFEDRNRAYAQNNKAYRITYRDAADIYYATNGRSKAKEEPKKTETPVSKERQEVAAKVSAPQGSAPGKPRPLLRPGMTGQDIMKLVNRGVI